MRIFGLAIAAEHTKLVALRVGERYPSTTVRLAMISDLGGAETDQPRNLLFTRCIYWPKIKMDAILDLLAFWYLDEEQTRVTVGRKDHAFFVAGLVWILRILAHAEHLRPRQ